MRIISGIYSRLLSITHLLWIKIIRFRKFFFIAPDNISPSTSFIFSKGSTIRLGAKVHTRKNVEFRVKNNGHILVGNSVFFNHYCLVECHEKITICDGCAFGPNVMLYDHDHDYKSKDGLQTEKFVSAPIFIGKNVWIGANTLILKGTTIGDNCVIAAGSVICGGNFPPSSLIVQKRETTVTTILK